MRLGKRLSILRFHCRTTGLNNTDWISRIAGGAEDFIYAGISAVLLLLINLSDAYWFLCFVALMPLIIRLSRASVVSSIRTGLLFGISYLLTLSINSLFIDLWPTILGICLGCVLISGLTGIVGWIRQRYGFNPVLTAVILVIIELGLIQIGLVESLLGEVHLSLPIFGAVSTLFGFVIVSFIIVLTNSLLLAAITKIVGYVNKDDRKYPENVNARWFSIDKSGYSEVLNLVPDSRGPPSNSIDIV